MTDFTIIIRSMRARLFSTTTTVLTVAVAVALMLVLLTMRSAGERAFQRGSGDMHLLVSADASPLVAVLNGIFYAGAPRRPLTWEKFQAIQRQAPWAYTVPTQIGDNFMGTPVLATSTDFFEKFNPNPREPWELSAGEFFTKEFEVVAGASAARQHGLRVGDTLYFGHGMKAAGMRVPAGQPLPGAHAHHDHDHAHDEDEPGHVHTEFGYKVVGILKPTGGSHDRALFTDMTSAWILHAHDRRVRDNAGKEVATTASDLLEEDRKITGIYLRLMSRDGSDSPANLPQVFDMLRRDPTITVAQPKQEIDKLFAIVGNVNQLLIAVATAVMLSSGIAILLALYNSMEQRRRQIAILRVLGASRFRVFGLVITESAMIGVLGAATGIVLGVCGSTIAAAALRTRVGLVVEALPEGGLLIVLAAATVVLASLAGIIPAVMAYRTGVARNLRPIG